MIAAPMVDAPARLRELASPAYKWTLGLVALGMMLGMSRTASAFGPIQDVSAKAGSPLVNGNSIHKHVDDVSQCFGAFDWRHLCGD